MSLPRIPDSGYKIKTICLTYVRRHQYTYRDRVKSVTVELALKFRLHLCNIINCLNIQKRQKGSIIVTVFIVLNVHGASRACFVQNLIRHNVLESLNLLRPFIIVDIIDIYKYLMSMVYMFTSIDSKAQVFI